MRVLLRKASPSKTLGLSFLKFDEKVSQTIRENQQLNVEEGSPTRELVLGSNALAQQPNRLRPVMPSYERRMDGVPSCGALP